MARFHRVPYVGAQAYSLSQCLKMALDYRGDSYALEYLECVSTRPFGFSYRREAERAVFAGSALDADIAAQRLLHLLGYGHTHQSFASASATLEALTLALDDGPVIAGPLDGALLPYTRERSTPIEHAVVILGLDGDHVIVNDPLGYVSMPVPLSDFLPAWRAASLPGVRPFALWQIGARGAVPDPLAVALQALNLAATSLRRAHHMTSTGSATLYGPEALRALARDTLAGTCHDWLAGPAASTWPAAAQHAADRADFLRHAPCANDKLRRAATISQGQAVLYGRAQLATLQGDRQALAETLMGQAHEEEQFAVTLEDGVQLARQRHASRPTPASGPLLTARAG